MICEYADKWEFVGLHRVYIFAGARQRAFPHLTLESSFKLMAYYLDYELHASVGREALRHLITRNTSITVVTGYVWYNVLRIITTARFTDIS